jgi:hypothetical protein
MSEREYERAETAAEPITLTVPDGHVVYNLGGFAFDRVVKRPEQEMASILYRPGNYRVVPQALLDEIDAMDERHGAERAAFNKRIEESPRFRVNVTLEPSS